MILPALLPALLTGFALAFARALGEYGSVVFIAGNMPMKTEITPLLIITKLEQYDYAGATAIAVVMLVASFAAAARSTCLQWWSSHRYADGSLTMAGTDRIAQRRQTCAIAPSRRARLDQMAADRAVPWAFSACSCFVPLAAVFAEALRKGLGAYFAQLRRPGGPGGHQADAARRRHRRAAQPGLRRGRRLGHRQVRLPRARTC